MIKTHRLMISLACFIFLLSTISTMANERSGEDTRYVSAPIAVILPKMIDPSKVESPIISAGMARTNAAIMALASHLSDAFGNVEEVDSVLKDQSKRYQFELSTDRFGASFTPFPGCNDGRNGGTSEARASVRVRVYDESGLEILSTVIESTGRGGQIGTCHEDGPAVDEAFQVAISQLVPTFVAEVLSRLSKREHSTVLSTR